MIINRGNESTEIFLVSKQAAFIERREREA